MMDIFYSNRDRLTCSEFGAVKMRQYANLTMTFPIMNRLKTELFIIDGKAALLVSKVRRRCEIIVISRSSSDNIRSKARKESILNCLLIEIRSFICKMASRNFLTSLKRVN